MKAAVGVDRVRERDDVSEFRVEDHPADQDVALLRRRLSEFNIEASGRPLHGDLSIFVRDADGDLTAGIHASRWANCCDVEYLWVAASHRGRGVGSRLLATIEEEARSRGCTRMVLTTFSFQARPFYERHGYEVVGTVPDYPDGFEYYLLTKTI